MKQSTITGLDPGFLKRTGAVALGTGVLVGLAAAYRWGWEAGGGFVAALFWAVANFAVLAAILSAATDPRGVRKARTLGLIVLKVFGLYSLGIWVLMQGWFPLPAVGAGFGWPLAVLVLGASSRMLLAQMRAGGAVS